MPFTFSHPAAVLPLRILPSHWFSFTGLVVGSMVPDFEYFLRMDADCNFSHTVAGVFLFDLPVGIIMAFIFYNIAANPFLDNIPSFLASRLSFLKNSDWNNYFKNNMLKVCVSIIAGALSHVVWDNFTHEHGHFTSAISGLSENINIFGTSIAFFHLLQHLSTLVGGLIVAVYIWRLPVDANYQPTFSARYWSIATVIFVLAISLRVWFGLGTNWFNNLAVSSISAGMIAVVSAPLFGVGKK